MISVISVRIRSVFATTPHGLRTNQFFLLLSCTGWIRIRKGDLPCFASSIVHGVPFLFLPQNSIATTSATQTPTPTGPSLSLYLLCHPSRLTTWWPMPGARTHAWEPLIWRPASHRGRHACACARRYRQAMLTQGEVSSPAVEPSGLKLLLRLQRPAVDGGGGRIRIHRMLQIECISQMF
jgi:hypothetical protein